MSQWFKRLLALGVVGMIAATAFVAGTMVISTQASSVRAPQAVVQLATAQPTYTTQNEIILANLYNNVAPSVVSIYVSFDNGEFNPQTGEGGSGGATGTGFVIDQSGRIVTNNHVVDNADQIEVNFYDGRITAAHIIGLDPDSDIAVIQVQNVPAEALIPLTFGNSDNLYVGQEVVAVGSPFNQPWTMTTGIVSALDRAIQGLTQFSVGSVIQTDAAINPGNSGGPLLNLQGEVIGVNSQIMSDSGSNSGIGFAIPSNLVSRVSQQLISSGEATYSYLGISGMGMSLSIMDALDIPNTTRGVLVLDVQPQSPAALAGLQNPVVEGSRQAQDLTQADIITAINGTPVTGMPSLISYLAYYTQPGQTINFTVLRGGQLFDLPVTLTERP